MHDSLQYIASFSHFYMTLYTAQKMKFSIKDFFSKFDQIRSFLRIWLHLLKKSLMENFIFCAVLSAQAIALKHNLVYIDRNRSGTCFFL